MNDSANFDKWICSFGNISLPNQDIGHFWSMLFVEATILLISNTTDYLCLFWTYYTCNNRACIFCFSFFPSADNFKMCPCFFVYQKSTPFYCSVFCACVVSYFNRVWLFVTLCTVACQAPLSLEFPRQEYWSGLPCPPLGDLPNPGIKPESPAWQADSSPTEPPGKTR